jgi:hypothetical protein
MKLVGIALIAVLHLTSCVGIGIVQGDQKNYSSFEINKSRSKPMRRVTESGDARNPTRQEVRSHWGEPDRVWDENGEERWRYQSGLAMRGAIPMLIVGIPLIAPVGGNHYEFHFLKGSERARNAIVSSNRMSGGYYGMSSFSDSKGFGYHKLGE